MIYQFGFINFIKNGLNNDRLGHGENGIIVLEVFLHVLRILLEEKYQEEILKDQCI